jgi:hypothetical protein
VLIEEYRLQMITMDVADPLKSAHLTTLRSYRRSASSAVKDRDVDVVEAVVIKEAADGLLLQTVADLTLVPSLEL